MANVAASSPSTGPSRLGKNAFFFIIVTVFIDMMAFAVIMPTLPYLMVELLDGKPALAAAQALAKTGDRSVLEAMISNAAPWGGFITTVYAIVNFLSQPVLGNLSDRFGRRPILLVSIGTLAIDFLIMGFAHSIWLLFLGRFLSGISGATHSTAGAYIADVTEPHQRAQAYGMLGAAFGLGFILGPAIGGLLGQFDPRWPFFASAILAGINFCYGMFVLPESLDHEHRRKFDWKRANALGAFNHFSKIPYLAWFLLALGLFNFSHWVYPATFNYFGSFRYGWDANMIGWSLAAVGVGSALVQGLLVGRVIKKFGPTQMVFFGFIICIVTFAAYAFAFEGWMVFVIIPVGALAGVLGPSLNQIMTARVPRNAQGELQGAMASVQALGNVFAPFAMTQTFHFFTRPDAPFQFAGAAFLLASVVCTISLLPLIQGLRTVPKVEEQPPDPKDEAAPEEATGATVAAQSA
ncbi:MAG: TCR/Tet family MFS transporter [Hyphomonadaceae bacterium]|nr:TCR/Tet family MFS transporter [Hyphomonadaceae bacterium]